MAGSKKPPATANDNRIQIVLTLSELTAKSGIDEDTLLRRMAKVLARRDGPDA